jgi:enoyl-CoA hydratase/carnithine racemase
VITMNPSYRQLRVRREAGAFWRATFDHPPINLVDFDTLADLDALVSELERSEGVKVLVLDSADPDFFIAHWDISARAAAAGSASSPPSWSEISLRFAQLPVVSIALIRGRARGMGSEVALGCDMRFGSLERAIFGQPEVGVGLVPGGGSMERLPLLAGRARALEIVLGADDFDAATAERYGWINRALPDAELEVFVTRLAHRLASFDKPALAAAKRIINRHTLPSADDLNATTAVFYETFGRPATRERARRASELGIGQRSDLEMRFGHYLPELAPDSTNLLT